MSNQIFINADEKYPEETEGVEQIAGKWENDTVDGEFSTNCSLTLSTSGNIVNMMIPLSTGTQTSNGNLTYTQLIPVKYRPESLITVSTVIKVAGSLVATPGLIQIYPDGIIRAHSTFDELPFVVGTYQIFVMTVSYPHALN